ncbi:MAG: hypothetical protein HUJ27_00215 [Rhodobacteraceae bacterium]|nr:hypothetical protein [Paracoccaceae bacterium]
MNVTDTIAEMLADICAAAEPTFATDRVLTATNDEERQNAILAEIGETILARSLTFMTGDGRRMVVEVEGRRLLKVDEVIPDAIAGRGADLFSGRDADIEAEQLEGLVKLLHRFCHKGGVLSVKSEASNLRNRSQIDGYSAAELQEAADNMEIGTMVGWQLESDGPPRTMEERKSKPKPPQPAPEEVEEYGAYEPHEVAAEEVEPEPEIEPEVAIEPDIEPEADADVEETAVKASLLARFRARPPKPEPEPEIEEVSEDDILEPDLVAEDDDDSEAFELPPMEDEPEPLQLSQPLVLDPADPLPEPEPVAPPAPKPAPAQPVVAELPEMGLPEADDAVEAFVKASKSFAQAAALKEFGEPVEGTRGPDPAVPMKDVAGALEQQVLTNQPFTEVALPGPKLVYLGARKSGGLSLCFAETGDQIAVATVEPGKVDEAVATMAAICREHCA